MILMLICWMAAVFPHRKKIEAFSVHHGYFMNVFACRKGRRAGDGSTASAALSLQKEKKMLGCVYVCVEEVRGALRGCKLSVSLKPAALPALYGGVILSVKMRVAVNVCLLVFLPLCVLHFLTPHSWSINTTKGVKKTIYFQMENDLNYSQLNHRWINEFGYWYPAQRWADALTH